MPINLVDISGRVTLQIVGCAIKYFNKFQTELGRKKKTKSHDLGKHVLFAYSRSYKAEKQKPALSS